MSTARATPPKKVRRVPKQNRSIQKVERILDAAAALLVKEGPDAFNTNRIAQEAQISVGSLYEYFPDKDAIVEDLIERLSQAESNAVLDRLKQLDLQTTSLSMQDVLALLIEDVVGEILLLHKETHGLLQTLWSVSRRKREVGWRPAEKLIIKEIEAKLSPLAAALKIENVALSSFTLFHLIDALATRFSGYGGQAWSLEQKKTSIRRAALGYLGIDGLSEAPQEH